MPKGFLIRRRNPKRPDNLQWLRRGDVSAFKIEATERKEGEFQTRKPIDYSSDIKPDNGLQYVDRTCPALVQNSQETFVDEQVLKVACSNNLLNPETSVSVSASDASVDVLPVPSFVRRFFPVERSVESCGDPGVAVIEAGEISSSSSSSSSSSTQCADFTQQSHHSESSSSLPSRWNGFEDNTAKYIGPIRSHGVVSYGSQCHYGMFTKIKSCLDLAEGRGGVTAIKDMFSYPATTWKSSFDRSRKRRNISNRWKAAAAGTVVVGSWACKADSKARGGGLGSKKSSDSRGTLETIENKIGEYICQLCKNYFPDAFRLADHNCSCIRHVEYRCTECNKVFNCPANLASHRRWHKPESNHLTTAAAKDQSPLRRLPIAGPSRVLTRPIDDDGEPFRARARSPDW